MKKNVLGWLLVLGLLSFAARAQPAQPDPLAAHRRALAAATTDTARGRHLWALSEFCDGGDSIIYFAQRAIAQLEPALPAARGAERRRLLSLLGAAVNNLAVGYGDRGGKQWVEPLFRRAARLRQQGGDVRGQVETLSNLALTLENRGDYAGAVRYLQQGIRAGEHVPAARALAVQCLTQLGTIYEILGDQGAEQRYQLRALPLLAQSGDSALYAAALSELAGTVWRHQRDTARAEAYARRAQQVAEATPGAGHNLILALLTRGRVRLRQRRLPAARAFLLQAQRLAVRHQSAANQVEIGLELAAVEEAAGRLPQALHAARQAAAIAAVVPVGFLVEKQEAAQTLARLYEKLGQTPAAFAQYRRYVSLRDSARFEESQKAGYRQRLQGEYEDKAAALRAAQDKRQAVAAAEIKRQKQMRLATSGGAILLLVLAGVLYNRFRFQRRATRLIEAQKAEVEKQKQRSDELLLNILPAEVAEELKDTGKTNARHFDLVTVLFSDVVGFTQLSEKLTPQVLVATLDTYFGAFDAITGRFGLEKIKTIGDAYMLAGGLGQGIAADPAAVVRAALAMLAVVEELRQEREPKGLPYFTLRIGVHTGPVVAGVVGVKKFAYDIWGDTVNTASRMESSGTAGKVNISEDTYTLVGERFVCTPRGKLAAKHKGEIGMYFVDGERAASVPGR